MPVTFYAPRPPSASQQQRERSASKDRIATSGIKIPTPSPPISTAVKAKPPTTAAKPQRAATAGRVRMQKATQIPEEIAAAIAAAPSAKALVEGTPQVAAEQDKTLPVGWTALESRQYPGETYYLGPDGPTWNHPNASASERRRKKERLASIYMKDYVKWESLETFNPKQLNEGTKASASYATHPIAKKDPSHFVSLKQQDFVPHKYSRAGHSVLWPIFTVSKFDSNSTYRSDFRSNSARRPARTRALTPPKMIPFDSNSTNRADFVDHHPKRPKLIHPETQLHFRHGTDIDSTYRVDFKDHGFRAVARSRRPRYFRDPGWIKNFKVGMSGVDSTDAELMAIKDPLADYDPEDEEHHMIPVIDGTLEGDHKSTYRSDFVEYEEVAPTSARRTSRDLDRSVVKRVKAYEELRGYE